jgi:hypothetical protein
MKKQFILLLVTLFLLNGCVLKRAFGGGKGHGQNQKSSMVKFR